MEGSVQRYLAARRRLGFKLRREGEMLLAFGRYADASGHHGPITRDLALRWITLPAGADRLYLARRLEVIRVFAKHCAAFDPRTQVPPARLFGRAHRRRQPHIYSEDEVGALLRQASRLRPQAGLRRHTYVTLLGLLAATGLRISEALHLARADVDLERGVLTVLGTKFNKSRLVPLHPSTTAALQGYAEKRNRFFRSQGGDHFFQDDRGSPLKYCNVFPTLQTLRGQLGWKNRGIDRPPRFHDFRHTVAVRCLVRSYAENVDVDQRIAALATYLGHVKVSDTYWYLTAVPELMALTAARFEAFATNQRKRSP
jgi:integrase